MIAISNLAYPNGLESELLPKLIKLGLQGVEVAPTRLAPWDELTSIMIHDYRQNLADIGLQVPALQAVLFGRQDVALLNSPTSFSLLIEHLKQVAAIAGKLGAKVAVFGSPKQRSRGSMTEDKAFDLGVERFRHCAEVCIEESGLVIGLEPVPSHYGGDFLCCASEAAAMVRAVDHPGLRLHLDSGCALLGGDDINVAIRNHIDILSHYHISEPDLEGFVLTKAEHEAAGTSLRELKYSGWCSIEMREAQNWQDACEGAVRFSKKLYCQ